VRAQLDGEEAKESVRPPKKEGDKPPKNEDGEKPPRKSKAKLRITNPNQE